MTIPKKYGSYKQKPGAVKQTPQAVTPLPEPDVIDFSSESTPVSPIKVITPEVVKVIAHAPVTPALDQQKQKPRDLKEKIAHLCDVNNYDPIKELLQVIEDSKGALRKEFLDVIEQLPDSMCKNQLKDLVKRIPTPDTREIIGIHKEILGYIAPKLKSVDMQGNVDHSFNINIVRFGT